MMHLVVLVCLANPMPMQCEVIRSTEVATESRCLARVQPALASIHNILDGQGLSGSIVTLRGACILAEIDT